MNDDFEHLGLLPNGLSTIVDDAIKLPKMTEEHDNYSVDCVSDKADPDTYKVEMVKCNFSPYFYQPVEQSTPKSVTLADAVPGVKDKIEQSDGEADSSSDAIADCDDEHDATQHIDSVFFACDHSSSGTVAVADIITYLRDTLHVSSTTSVVGKYLHFIQ